MASKTLNTYNPQSVSIPGETIQDLIDELGMKQPELAERMGIHVKTLNEIIKGKNPITPETALHLERILKVPANFWLSREQQFREFLARQEEYKKLITEVDWLKELPVNQMVKYGWVKEYKNKVEQLIEMFSFFGVASRNEWNVLWMQPQAAYRISLNTANEPGAIAAWLRYGEIKSKDFERKYDEQLFKSNLKKIKKLAFENPDNCVSKLKELCNEAGVIVVFTPPVNKAKISGAVRWVGNNPIIQLSNRWKMHDRFWFTFFHESAHVLLHGKKDYFIEGNSDIDHIVKKENEADEYAADFMIPKNDYKTFTSTSVGYTQFSVSSFAKKIKVHTGIVVGRLQHDKKIAPSHLNNLKLTWEIEMD